MNQEHKKKMPKIISTSLSWRRKINKNKQNNLNKSEEHSCSPPRRRLTSNSPPTMRREDGQAAPRDGGSGRGQLLGSPFYRGGDLSQPDVSFSRPFSVQQPRPCAFRRSRQAMAVGGGGGDMVGSRAKISWWTKRKGNRR
jgi:hypothetical protein